MKRTIDVALPVNASQNVSKNKRVAEITINVAINANTNDDVSVKSDIGLASISENVFDFHKDVSTSNFLSSSGFGSPSGFNGFCGSFLSSFSFGSPSVMYDSEFIGFIHNSAVIVKHVYFFKCNNVDVMSFVNDTLVPNFGNNIKCCYVKCNNAINIMNKLLENTKENDSNIDLIPNCIERKFIFKCNAHKAEKLLMKMSGVHSAYNFQVC